MTLFAQLLELRRDRGARQRQQVQADAVLRIAGRRSHARHVAHVWRCARSLVGLGPQLQNLKKNESGLPLSVVDQVRAGDRAGIALTAIRFACSATSRALRSVPRRP